MPYPWMSPDWAAKAAAAEMKVQPLLTRRRWTDKDVIGGHVVFWPDWPRIPKGVGAGYEGEPALRVFIEITDGDDAHKAPQEAFLVAKLSGADAVRAGLTKDDAFLVVTHRFFDWVAGALGFDKKVLLSLSWPIMERSLLHKDAEIQPELVWITPMKKEDRRYYYSVLPLVGMGGVIDPAKGNPGIFRELQPAPYRHIVWDVVDEVIDGGTSAWGTAAASGDGAATLFALKLRFVNFLRDLADKFQEEEFARMLRQGEFDRGEVAKAISNGLWRHLPDIERIAKESRWLERADIEDGLRPAVRALRAGRLFSYSQALTQILKHAGQGWTNPQEWGDLLTKLAWRAESLSGAAELLRMKRTPSVEDDDIRDAARKMYQAGKISRRELVLFGEAMGEPNAYADDDLYKGVAEEMERELRGVLGGRYFTD